MGFAVSHTHLQQMLSPQKKRPLEGFGSQFGNHTSEQVDYNMDKIKDVTRINA